MDYKFSVLYGSPWLKYTIGGSGSLSISGPLRDPADVNACIVDVNWVRLMSPCIVDVNWAPDLLIIKFLGPG